MRKKLFLFGLLGLAPIAAGQGRTVVSGTLVDANGLPLSGGKLTATLTTPVGTAGAYLFGSQINGVVGPVTLDATGSFLLNLADNTLIQCATPAGALVACVPQTQWVFSVTVSPGVAPPLGSGPQQCSATLTISGSSQTVTTPTCPALAANGAASVVTKTLYVDNQRTDTYTQTGAKNQPFKTIMGAVNQVIANGDNASVCYLIDMSGGLYNELVVLENLALNCLVFDGHDTAILSGNVAGIRSQVNNNNLIAGGSLTGIGVTFLHFPLMSPANGVAWTFNNANTSWDVRESVWSLNNWAVSSNAGTNPQVNVYDSVLQINLQVNGLLWAALNTTINAGGFVTITNGGIVNYLRGSRNSGGGNISIDATSSFTIAQGARCDAPVTVNGGFGSRSGSLTTGDITVNSGGLYTETGGSHSGALILNAGSTYTTAGSMAVVIAGGTVAMPTAAIAGGACSTAATGTVTKGTPAALVTADTVFSSFSGGLPGINPGELVISYTIASNGSAPTFQYCNETGAPVTPPATTLNWKVIR